MARLIQFVRVLKEGVTYRAKPRQAFIIERIGCDAATKCALKVANVTTGVIDRDVAPLHKTSSNLLGMLDLGSLFYVVKPEEEFAIEADSGAKAVVAGKALILESGEPIPSELEARHSEQGKHYLRKFEGSFSLGTDVAWGADVAYEVLSITPLTDEKIVLNNVFMVSISGDTVNEGDFAVELWLDNVPIENITAENWYAGYDAKYAPYPPADTTEMIALSFKENPIEVLGDHTLSVKVRNVSGASKSPASGSSWTVKVKFVAEYLKMSSR